MQVMAHESSINTEVSQNWIACE